MNSRRPEILKKSLLSLASLTIALFVVETIVRIFGLGAVPEYVPRLFVMGDFQRPWCEPASCLMPIHVGEHGPNITQEGEFSYYQWKPNLTYAHRYPSNPRGYFDANNEVHFRINNYGFRGPDITPEDASSPEGHLQIVLLGDSFTWGDGVSFEDTFGEVLRKQLAASAPAKQARVINLSQPGLNTSHEGVLWRSHRGLVDPDLVILAFTPNDIYLTKAQEDQKRLIDGKYMKRFQPPAGLARISHLYRLAERTIDGASIEAQLVDITVGDLHKGSEKDRSPWQRYTDELTRLRDDVTADGAKFMVVVIPFLIDLDTSYPYTALHEAIGNFCAQSNIPVVDLLPLFVDFPPEELWAHPVDHHPNERAHAIIAEAILSALNDPLYPGTPAP